MNKENELDEFVESINDYLDDLEKKHSKTIDNSYKLLSEDLYA